MAIAIPLSKANLQLQPCGCLNFIDPEWGVLRSYQKCDHHKSMSGKSGLAYHEEMGAIKNGVVQHENYERELLECVEIPEGPGRCLEIACGVGSYIPLLADKLGYQYDGLEPDIPVADFVSEHFDALVYTETYENLGVPRPEYDLIFCAHAFEHMEDSPGMMAKAFSQLKPGGRLVLIVPNDEDKCNPDHLWFWRSEDLHRVLSRIGFTDIKTVEKRRVPHEMFIYASAVKP